MLLYTCGSCISYFVIIGDLFLDAFSFLLPSVSFLQNRAIVVGSICLFLIFPLCMLRSSFPVSTFHIAVDSLKYVSVVSILSILVTAGVITVAFASHPTVNPTVELMHITSRIISVIPMMCVSFNCHYNVPRYYYVPRSLLFLYLA